MSDQFEGESEPIDLAGRVGPGTRIRAARCKVCEGAFAIGFWTLFIWAVNFVMASSVDSGYDFD